MADKRYEIIVIGAGHAGCEAALAAARMGEKTALFTVFVDNIAQMSCNPAIGGIAKGQLVAEIDSLGGEMGKNIDATGIQFRMLNTKKGPAVQSLRAQADMYKYKTRMRYILENQENLDIKQEMVEEIIVSENEVTGIKTNLGNIYHCKAVILAAGTFLRGKIFIGLDSFSAGRAGDMASEKLSYSLMNLGIELKRLKTGTTPRINKNSINFEKVQEQKGDEIPVPFSIFSEGAVLNNNASCYITHTNEETHTIIRGSLDRSPLYGEKLIQGVGPRYCPSIEDKVVKFPDKTRHQIFLEPEGLDTLEYYCNGVPTSLPYDVQESFLHSINGLEDAEIIRPGYAIEYDYAPPVQIKHNLESKRISGLFFAGQVNGTSGYEEAAAQGIMAGINAVLKASGSAPFVLKRSEAYIGVLIDDLVTKGTNEPYRLFTSRAEYRLFLRQDNAPLRLIEYGYRYGLIPKPLYDKYEGYKKAIPLLIKDIKKQKVQRNGKNISVYDALKQKPVSLVDIYPEVKDKFDKKVIEQAEIDVKYEGYMRRELSLLRNFEKLENIKIPNGFKYDELKVLKSESLMKLKEVRPENLMQAYKIPGVSPADISILMVFLRRYEHR